MKPTIGEFQFASGVNREFEMGKWRFPLSAPPRIPTQNMESQVGYDMDSEISTGVGVEPIFIQYKRSEHMVGNAARYWGSFPSDYYRFKIENADQHNTLVKTADYFRHTYYVAPHFSTNKEYIEYHKNGEIVENSVFATCFGLPEMSENDSTDKHTIGFDQDCTLFFSEPEEIDSFTSLSDLLRDIAEDENAFREMGELKRSFAELNSILIDQYHGLEVPSQELQPGNWIRAQQEFFASIGINLCFAFDTDSKPKTRIWVYEHI